jgi:hypothetical protein
MTWAFGLLALAAVATAFGLHFWWRWKTYFRLPTYDRYCELNPQRCRAGLCHCSKCGSGRISINSLMPDERRHICRNCGTVLYRS